MSIPIAMPRMSTDPELTTAQSKYVESLARAGASVRWVELADPDKAVAEALECAGLLLPGGGDIEPSLFGQERVPACGEPNPLRDAAEPKLLHAFLAAGKPILGICRGIQVLNAFLGGELYQDIKPLEHVPHNDHWAKIHTVTVRRDTLLAEILKQDTVLVNSQHHQAASRVAPGLEIAALSEDGFIEALAGSSGTRSGSARPTPASRPCLTLLSKPAIKRFFMKIAILGLSGSGKSTLAKQLGSFYHAPVLHLDAVHFLPGWVERVPGEEEQLVTSFLDTHSSWVMDGNYTKTCYARRLEEADQIIVLAFNRFLCLWRVIRRWWANRGAVRDSSAPGCMEKIDAEFVWWVLYQGRTPARIAGYRQIARQYPEKFILIQNPRQLARFLSSGSYSQ